MGYTRQGSFCEDTPKRVEPSSDWFISDILITDSVGDDWSYHADTHEGGYFPDEGTLNINRYIEGPTNNNLGDLTVDIYLKIPDGVPETAVFSCTAYNDSYELSDFTEGEYTGGYTHKLTLTIEETAGVDQDFVDITIEASNDDSDEPIEGHIDYQINYYAACLSSNGITIDSVYSEFYDDESGYLLDKRSLDSTTPIPVSSEGYTFSASVGYAGTVCPGLRLTAYDSTEQARVTLATSPLDEEEVDTGSINEYQGTLSNNLSQYEVDIMHNGEAVRTFKFELTEAQPAEPVEPGE